MDVEKISCKELINKFDAAFRRVDEYLDEEVQRVDELMKETKESISDSSLKDKLLIKIIDKFKIYAEESEKMYDELETYANQIISHGSEIMEELGSDEYIRIIPLAQFTINHIKKRREECMKKRQTFCMLLMMLNQKGVK